MKRITIVLSLLVGVMMVSGCRKPIEGETNKPVPKDVLSKGTEMGQGGPGAQTAPGADQSK